MWCQLQYSQLWCCQNRGTLAENAGAARVRLSQSEARYDTLQLCSQCVGEKSRSRFCIGRWRVWHKRVDTFGSNARLGNSLGHKCCRSLHVNSIVRFPPFDKQVSARKRPLFQTLESFLLEWPPQWERMFRFHAPTYSRYYGTSLPLSFSSGPAPKRFDFRLDIRESISDRTMIALSYIHIFDNCITNRRIVAHQSRITNIVE